MKSLSRFALAFAIPILLPHFILLATHVAQAANIVGFGDPISRPELTGGTVIDFDNGPTGFYFTVTTDNITFDVDPNGGPFEWGPDFNGQFNTSGGFSCTVVWLDPDRSPSLSRHLSTHSRSTGVVRRLSCGNFVLSTRPLLYWTPSFSRQ